MATTESRAPDGCVVRTSPLTSMVRSFIDTWNETRPTANTGQYSRGAHRQRTTEVTMDAVSWLEQESGVDRTTISNVKTGKRKTTELRDADRLVSALGYPQAFHDGTLEVLPNPRAPRAARALCCSGSLTGSAIESIIRQFS